MGRFLFIRDGGLGDCLLVLPLIESLRAVESQAEIAFMLPARYCGVVSQSVARPVVLPIERAVRPELFAPDPDASRLDPFDRWDRIYSFHGGDEMATLLSRRSPTRYLDPRPLDDEYIVHHLARILAEDGIALTVEAPTIGGIPARPDSAVMIVHPGGGTGRKRWDPKKYPPMLERLRRRHPGLRVSLLIGEAEADLAAPLAPHFDVMLEQPALDSLPVLLAGRPYLGMDSGPTHLAAASGARVLALFGPTSPRIWAQRRHNYQFLSKLEEVDSDTVSDKMSELIENAQGN